MCPECTTRPIAPGKTTCYPCHLQGVGFGFVGGGGYGRQAFRSRTITEYLRANVGDPKTNKNIEKIPTGSWT